MQSPQESEVKPPPRGGLLGQATTLRCVVTVAALAIAIGHVVWPTLVPDAITAGFLLLAFLPWLAPLIKSVEVPGVGKIELQEVRREAQEAKGAALSADHKAALAIAGGPRAEISRGAPPAINEQELAALAAEYEHIRDTQRSGPARTANMTDVIWKMITASSALPDDEVRRRLKDPGRGMRLVAYASLYARPRGQLLDELVDSICHTEGTPFGQYWAIQALGRVIAVAGKGGISPRALNELETLLHKLQPDTDRHYELKRILEGLRDS